MHLFNILVNTEKVQDHHVFISNMFNTHESSDFVVAQFLLLSTSTNSDYKQIINGELYSSFIYQ